MTNEDALIHFETCLGFLEEERALFIKGRVDGDDAPLWANNRGAESAIANLSRLIENYQRIVRLLSDRIRSKQ